MRNALIFGLLGTFWAVSAWADEAAVAAADDARVAAMQAAYAAKLNEILADDLRYSHSNGVVDTKASLIQLLTSGAAKYVAFDYEERNFTFPAPDVALMSGRARVVVETAKGGMDAVLAFLAVWRKGEDGQWRFLAWQSCRLPAEEKAKP